MSPAPGFDNAPNFRDLGGFPVAGGGRVKSGLVFRSDDLSSLSSDEISRLAALQLRTVVDFRSVQEARYAPDRLPSTVAHRIDIRIDAASLLGNFYGGALNRRKAMGMMVSVYRQLAGDFASSYRLFFEALADGEKLPLLFHCAAGKDRTGFAAALFLSALGVERELIVRDYLLSAECLRRKYVKGTDYDEVSEPFYSVFPEFIEAAFAVVDATPGGIEGYLRDRLGVDTAAMRAMFTEA